MRANCWVITLRYVTLRYVTLLYFTLRIWDDVLDQDYMVNCLGALWIVTIHVPPFSDLNSTRYFQEISSQLFVQEWRKRLRTNVLTGANVISWQQFPKVITTTPINNTSRQIKNKIKTFWRTGELNRMELLPNGEILITQRVVNSTLILSWSIICSA